ncbi:MAG: outer membrane protein [Methylocella sp.]
MCKQFLLASAGAFAIAGSAFAAEPAPIPPPPPPFTWSGVYLGGQIGYAWGKDNVSWSGTANDLDLAGGKFGEGPQGVIGGAHLGWNIQPNHWFVFGIEASVDGAGLNKSVVVPMADFAQDTFGSLTASAKAGVQGSVRGRLGIAFDRLLLYGTGGVAVTSYNTSYYDTTGFFTGFPGTNDTISVTRAGFTAGGGIEYAITDNWSVRAEYRYSNFGHVTDYPFSNPNAFVSFNQNAPFPAPAGGFVVARHNPDQSQVQVGFSYRFDMMVPPPPGSAPVPPGPPAAPVIPQIPR